MNLTLERKQYRADGIYGELQSPDGSWFAVTLEHAYQNDAGFLPKIPDGKYLCARGFHRLPGMTADFETFEITGVSGHSGLLFHCGNFNHDSSGCVLVGRHVILRGDGRQMISQSREGFDSFMTMQRGVTGFELEVL